jgi:hypothetical protein
MRLEPAPEEPPPSMITSIDCNSAERLLSDGSALTDAELHCASIEAGHDRSVIKNHFIVDLFRRRSMCSCSRSAEIDILSTISILGVSCFSCCMSLSSISYESGSQLTRIEAKGF